MKFVAFAIEPLESRIAPSFAANLILADLDGTEGFKISGAFLDAAVSGAGDINGDGFSDIVIGDPFANSFDGASYVVFGTAAGFPADVNLSTLNGSNGFKITAEDDRDQVGSSVSGAGDVNADGFADLLIGARFASPNGTFSGASYVIFGKRSGFDANLNLSSLNGSNGFKISGEARDDNSGSSVSGAGDFNRDGFADLLIGAPADVNGAASGAAYVIFGKRTGFSANLNLSSLDGNNGFKISGVTAGDRAGSSVSGADDVNRDGFADLLIGAPGADPNGAASGASYVVFGNGAGFGGSLNLSALDGTNGFKISGDVAGDYAGSSVSEAGDINGDGFSDLLMGAPGVNGIYSAASGASYVIFGNATGFAGNLNLSALDGINGFKISELDGAGDTAVSNAGDINDDGFVDIIIGVHDAAASYVVYGKDTGFGANLNVSSLDGTNGFKITGGGAGISVSDAGDINGDGVADVIIGTSGSGASYVVFGAPLVTFSKNQRSATFIESDGDTIVVKVDRSSFTRADFTLIDTGNGALLRKLDLTRPDAHFEGATITISAKPAPTPIPDPFGPQLAALSNTGINATQAGEINASGVNLRKLEMEGNATRIEVGSGDQTKPAIKVLRATSVGMGRENFPDIPPGLDVQGIAVKVVIKEDIVRANVHVTEKLAQLVVGGEIIESDLVIGKGMSLMKVGGAMTRSSVKTAQGLGKLVVTGALEDSDFDIGASLGSVKAFAGIVDSTFKVASVLGSLTVTGNLGESDVNVGTALKKVKVVGSVADSEITVGGVLQPRNAGKAKAIGSISIVGDFERSQILAGYDLTGAAKNADVIVGGITITGRFKESSIVAGVLSTDGTFGSGDDGLIGGGNGVIAKIAAITIKGEVLGTTGNADDGFGIVAEQIGKLKIGTTAVVLNKGFSNDPSTAIGGTDDVRVHEVGSVR